MTRIFGSIVLAAALASGCEGKTPWPPEPAPLALGEEACTGCKMIVSDGRFAAELRTREGGLEFYDDLGCFVETWKGRAPDLAGVFVRDYASSAWVRGDRCRLVKSGAVKSPMGYGFAAFETDAAAGAEAARHADASRRALADLVR